MNRIHLVLLILFAVISGCDHGFEPPERGKISGTIIFKGKWPPAEEVRALYFGAAPFTPCSVDDIVARFSEVALSNDLNASGTGIEEATFSISDVNPAVYVYSGVYLQYGPTVLEIKPVGVFSENNGAFIVSSGQTTEIDLTVDFDQLPPFPPASCSP
ncbi:MAG TPA: hypothetical protein PLO56_13655 [Rhodothermales bacterium]|nr:hypothetical protein [Rhodothermales bacterium]